MKMYKARVKYEGKEWLVIDSFTYNGKKYMYIASDLKIDLNSAEDLNKYKDQIKMIFIENTGDNNYVTVEDEKILGILNLQVTQRLINKKA